MGAKVPMQKRIFMFGWRSLGALLLINVLLLGCLVIMNGSVTRAMAQLGVQSDYVMIAGEIQSRQDQEAIYILDLSTQKMVAIGYDSRTRKLLPLGVRTITEDVRLGSGGR
jgi:hypothetical protein